MPPVSLPLPCGWPYDCSGHERPVDHFGIPPADVIERFLNVPELGEDDLADFLDRTGIDMGEWVSGEECKGSE